MSTSLGQKLWVILIVSLTAVALYFVLPRVASSPVINPTQSAGQRELPSKTNAPTWVSKEAERVYAQSLTKANDSARENFGPLYVEGSATQLMEISSTLCQSNIVAIDMADWKCTLTVKVLVNNVPMDRRAVLWVKEVGDTQKVAIVRQTHSEI